MPNRYFILKLQVSLKTSFTCFVISTDRGPYITATYTSGAIPESRVGGVRLILGYDVKLPPDLSSPAIQTTWLAVGRTKGEIVGYTCRRIYLLFGSSSLVPIPFRKVILILIISPLIIKPNILNLLSPMITVFCTTRGPVMNP